MCIFGWVVDVTGSFNASFYIAGAVEASGGILFIMNVVWRYSCHFRGTAPHWLSILLFCLFVIFSGISIIFSKILFGCIGDRSEVFRHYLLAISLILEGLVSVLVFLFNTYETLIIYCIVFAVTGGKF